MRFANPPYGAITLITLALTVTAAEAGQVRVNVTLPNFAPANITLNQGDHAVWVWTSGSHTVTSGNSSTGTPNGIFDSGGEPFGISGARFTWKSPTSNLTTQYFCAPHLGLMAGTVTVVAGSAPVSNFRITEVYFDAPNGQEFVEITNLGDDAGNLGQYRLSVRAGTPLLFPLADINVPPGGHVVVWVNRSGTNSQTELFFGSEPQLARTGSAGLYAPNTINPSLAAPDQLIDFVQWGAGGQLNESTASSAGYWNGGDFVEAVAQGHTIEFCGNGTQHGRSFWFGIQNATPGSSDCLSPTISATWGRIKALYR